MDNKMSQDQIDTLIAGFSKAESVTSDIGESMDSDEKIISNVNNRHRKEKRENNLYKSIDFRKPNKLQYDNLGALKQIHEHFIKDLNNYLTVFLRCSIQSEMDFELLEQVTYQQYVNLGNKNTLWCTYTVSDSGKEQGKCFIQFENALCNFFIDRTYGGSSPFESLTDGEEIKMADINKEMSKKLFLESLKMYQNAWNNSNIVNFLFKIANVEDNIQNLNLGVMGSEMMLVIPIKLEILQKHEDEEEVETNYSTIKIGIPYSVIEPVLDKLNMSNILSLNISSEENEEVKASIQSMHTNIDVFIGETIEQFIDLVTLGVGDIISLNKKTTDSYTVLVGGIPKLKGVPYKFGSKLCVKITE